MERQIEESQKKVALSDSEFKDELRATIIELRAVTLATAQMQSSQDVTNKMVSSALDALERRLEANNHRIAELEQTRGLMSELIDLMRRQLAK